MSRITLFLAAVAIASSARAQDMEAAPPPPPIPSAQTPSAPSQAVQAPPPAPAPPQSATVQIVSQPVQAAPQPLNITITATHAQPTAAQSIVQTVPPASAAVATAPAQPVQLVPRPPSRLGVMVGKLGERLTRAGWATVKIPPTAQQYVLMQSSPAQQAVYLAPQPATVQAPVQALQAPVSPSPQEPAPARKRLFH